MLSTVRSEMKPPLLVPCEKFCGTFLNTSNFLTLSPIVITIIIEK